MRVIDADSIEYTEYINGDITVSKQKIDNMTTVYDINNEIFTNGYNAALEDFKNTLIDKMEIGPCVGEKFAKFDNFDIEDIAEKLKKEVKD